MEIAKRSERDARDAMSDGRSIHVHTILCIKRKKQLKEDNAHGNVQDKKERRKRTTYFFGFLFFGL